MDRTGTSFKQSALLLAAGALAGAALVFGATRPATPAAAAAPHAAVAAPAPAAPVEGDPPSNEISDFPQLD
jgi:hypothetical protein